MMGRPTFSKLIRSRTRCFLISIMELPAIKQEKIKLNEINQYLTCYLCKGYLIDATTITECLHSFCRSCIIKFLHDNSYCPVCELIINKAKPNLKLDKTLQDIVYKLVPALFLKEMLRRKTFYKDYPEISARVSPEERGEDTERTIFNPQEMISLSLEYICDDSTPGAIRIPGIAIDPETLKTNGTVGEDENQDSQMKRYLLCPGMCRIEVLKKFVRNKYNVDTSQFFIDVLYKRVPLPDHYTLIDIAYIYSWQRNELMKFFFRIVDHSKSKRTDSPVNNVPQFIPKPFRRSKSGAEKPLSAAKRRETDRNKKSRRKSLVGKGASRNPSRELFKENRSRVKVEDDTELVESETSAEPNRAKNGEEERIKTDRSAERDKDKCIQEVPNRPPLTCSQEKDNKAPTAPPTEPSDLKIVPPLVKTEVLKSPVIKQEPLSPKKAPPEEKLIVTLSKDILEEINHKSFSKPITKSYTSITLNRSENVEIITKIEPVSNSDGLPIGHHIIKQTIKKGSKVKTSSPRKASKMGQVTVPRLVISKKKKASLKSEAKKVLNASQTTCKSLVKETKEADVASPKLKVIENRCEEEDEKSKFLKYVELTPRLPSVKKLEGHSEYFKQPVIKPLPQVSLMPQQSKKRLIISRPTGGQKRKSCSPLKNDRSKNPKVETKKPVKIILQEKPSSSFAASGNKDLKNDSGLQSLINSCKLNIPSSLSITIKEGNESENLPPVVPPVKNYIEILKLPDDGDKDKLLTADNKFKETPQPLDISKFCDNDSEQKVDEDLSEIARSLTEKIPMSTTVSQIVGPKQQFPIPVKTNIPQKVLIQPSPVPELSQALSITPTSTTDGLAKLNPRSPQTFQKIFEESLKKSPEAPKTSAAESPEASALPPKKIEVEEEAKKEEAPLPKVPIPRLPNPRRPKPAKQKFERDQMNKLVPQTVANLHSSSLGMNYSVSVGQQSPTKTGKSNGIVSPITSECKIPLASPVKEVKTDFKVPSPSVGSLRPSTPSPKHSPKSSPLIKHMYAPTLPVFNQQKRFPSLSPKPTSTSPRPSGTTSPKTPTPKVSPSSTSPSGNAATLTPNEILEKYNIQNLAQLTASFSLNQSILVNNQLAAYQQAIFLKQFEMQNRHNWLNRNQGPLGQYEKYLQSLNGSVNGSPSHS